MLANAQGESNYIQLDDTLILLQRYDATNESKASYVNMLKDDIRNLMEQLQKATENVRLASERGAAAITNANEERNKIMQFMDSSLNRLTRLVDTRDKDTTKLLEEAEILMKFQPNQYAENRVNFFLYHAKKRYKIENLLYNKQWTTDIEHVQNIEKEGKTLYSRLRDTKSGKERGTALIALKEYLTKLKRQSSPSQVQVASAAPMVDLHSTIKLRF